MLIVLTTGAVKQREVTDPITTCCGAEQSPYVRILVHRLAAGTSPLAKQAGCEACAEDAVDPPAG
jgi:hypothetical protein